MSNDVYAIIPNRIEKPHQGWLLKKCLESLFDFEPSMAGRVIVCDDHSPLDKLMMSIVEKFPVKLMKHKERVNYSKMINSGISVATQNRASGILTINNDIENRSKFLEEIEDLCEKYAHLAVIGCLLYYPDGSVQHGGVDVSWEDGSPFCTDSYRSQAFDIPKSRFVHHCTGAWNYIRLPVATLYQESFPLTFQDVDHSLRLWERGFKTYFTNRIFHVHAESSTRGKVVTRNELESSRIFKAANYDVVAINKNLSHALSLSHGKPPTT